jgi:Na+-driven multidrug efflux pump
VSGAAYGAREFEKIEIAYSYALKVCVAVEGVFALLMVLFASQITWIFTWSSDSERIVNDLIVCLRILWVLLPAAAFGMLSAAMFQGVGKGLYALMTTLLRTLVLNVPLAWFFGIQLDMGLRGVWIGMATAGLMTVPIAFGWAMLLIKMLERGVGKERVAEPL